MGNCLEISKFELPDIRIRIRSNCCNAKDISLSEKDNLSENDEPDALATIPEEDI